MCADGTCVSMSVFCDFKQDCPDNSDENNCGKTVLLYNYTRRIMNRLLHSL